MKYILRYIAWLNNWLAERYIPKDTPYCYTLVKILENHDKLWERVSIRCPYLSHRENPELDENEKPFYWQYCSYIQADLSIQDSCKDCLINMDKDFYE